MLYEITEYIPLLDVDNKDIFLACIFVTDFIFQHNIQNEVKVSLSWMYTLYLFSNTVFSFKYFFISVFYLTKQGRNEIKYSSIYWMYFNTFNDNDVDSPGAELVLG